MSGGSSFSARGLAFVALCYALHAMTIAMAYLVSDGVVLGADSASTILDPSGSQVIQVLNHAQKIFEVGEPGSSHLAMCIWGAGSLNAVAHRTIAARLTDRITSITPVAKAAEWLCEIVKEEAGRQQRDGQPPLHQFGYFLGGCDPRTHLPSCHGLVFTKGRLTRNIPLKIGEANFQGGSEYFSRTVRGYSPALPDLLSKELCARLGSEIPDLDTIVREAFAEAVRPLESRGTRNLPIREVIDLVDAHLRITVKAIKFQYGPRVFGGPSEIGFVTTDRPFRWSSHKGFDSALTTFD